MMTSSSNRFDAAFKLFEQVFSSFLDEFKKQDLVFSCDLNPQENLSSFRVYENKKPSCHLQSPLFRGTEIKLTPGKDLVYQNRLWFFYEQTPEETKLEALMSFVDAYMPIYYVKLDEPLMSLTINCLPKIPGICIVQKEVPENQNTEQLALL